MKNCHHHYKLWRTMGTIIGYYNVFRCTICEKCCSYKRGVQ